jgi:DNA invertase Pin-like site-specific DNA recombinase
VSLVGYGRISTSDQNTDAQRDALTAAGCERIFLDTASGKLARRPKLDAALDFLRPGDTLVITKLDRLGRSVRNLVELSATLAKREVDLRVLNQGMTPARRALSGCRCPWVRSSPDSTVAAPVAG